MLLVLADAVAAVHLLAVGFLLVGGLLAWRWPRLLRLHVPVAGAILAVNLAGADCPLTDLELRLLTAAGERPYDGGFIGHHLVSPFWAGGRTPAVERLISAVAFAPNAVAYGVLSARWLRAGRRAAAGSAPRPTSSSGWVGSDDASDREPQRSHARR